MSLYHEGDTFKIEIAEVFQGAESRNDKYRIKGFDNLVFDDKGLGRLEPVKVDKGIERRYETGDVVYNNGEFYLVLWESPEYELVTLVDKEKTLGKLKKSSVTYEGTVPVHFILEFLNDIREWATIVDRIEFGE